MFRVLRSLLMTRRFGENITMKSTDVPFFVIVAITVIGLCLMPFLASTIANVSWKLNWHFGLIEKDGHFKFQRWHFPKDFQFEADASIEKIINYFQWSNSSSCELARDFGGTLSVRTLYNELEGRTSVCFNPKEIAPSLSGCLVYAFNVNDEWSFEKAMAAYGCQVFVFNPRTHDDVSDRNRRLNIRFFPFKLGSKSFDSWAGETQRSTKTLGDIYEKLSIWHGEESIIDYLKLDIEWGEWHILPQIIESGMMDKVRQLAVEIHLPYRAPFFERGQSLAQFRRLANIVRAVENCGMVRFNSKADLSFQGTIPALNFSGPLAYEITWYNSRFL
ncbi:uncharacterized protein LOC123474016 [Daphnia magna]|uniref:uncharacterized protein LOC123474016 n=1 Tax=Daphnia magna TaxID=35525 RepID=UPI001E1BBF98|nr:uncharacterized protein LOC123474016 [Daphnia magna]